MSTVDQVIAVPDFESRLVTNIKARSFKIKRGCSQIKRTREKASPIALSNKTLKARNAIIKTE
jgi:hypothetical protein